MTDPRVCVECGRRLLAACWTVCCLGPIRRVARPRHTTDPDHRPDPSALGLWDRD